MEINFTIKCLHTVIGDEVLDEVLPRALVAMHVDEATVVVVGDDRVLGVPGHVYHLGERERREERKGEKTEVRKGYTLLIIFIVREKSLVFGA